jgi:ATP-dependent DNA helicase RecG
MSNVITPQSPLSAHFRLTPQQLKALKRLGLITIEDLLRHFPARYESAGSTSSTRELIVGTKVTLFGTLSGLKAKKMWKSRRNMTEGYFEDASGRVKVMWFNQPYMASYVPEGSVVKVTGSVGGKADKPYIANPEVEIVPKEFAQSASGLFALKLKRLHRQSMPYIPRQSESRPSGYVTRSSGYLNQG